MLNICLPSYVWIVISIGVYEAELYKDYQRDVIEDILW